MQDIIDDDEITQGFRNMESIIRDECIYQKYIKDFPKTSMEYEVTVVTAFFDIGPFEKNIYEGIRTPSYYTKWLSVFEYLNNPLYVYVDSIEYKTLFENVRRNSQRKTKIILVNREDIWGFSLRENISSIYSDPEYPKVVGKTTNAEYTCAMHAKFDVMLKSVNDNKFQTKYFAWLDIGYYRDTVNATNQFKIYLPPCFDDSRVSYNELYTPRERTIQQIITNEEVWVGGGIFLAEKNVMRKWVQDYMYFVERFIQLGWISSDQEVIYAMRQPSIHKELGKRRIAIQEYNAYRIFGLDPWFGLGYLCRKELEPLDNKTFNYLVERKLVITQ